MRKRNSVRGKEKDSERGMSSSRASILQLLSQLLFVVELCLLDDKIATVNRPRTEEGLRHIEYIQI